MLYLLVQLNYKIFDQEKKSHFSFSKRGHYYQFSSVFVNLLLHGMYVVLVFGSDSPFLTKTNIKPGEMCNPKRILYRLFGEAVLVNTGLKWLSSIPHLSPYILVLCFVIVFG